MSKFISPHHLPLMVLFKGGLIITPRGLFSVIAVNYDVTTRVPPCVCVRTLSHRASSPPPVLDLVQYVLEPMKHKECISKYVVVDK